MAMVTVGRRPATPWKIGVGVFLVFGAVMAAYSSEPNTDGIVGALGGLIGVCIYLFGGIALIAWGLPKTMGNREFVKRRRRLWLTYMSLGFVLMVLAAVAGIFSGFITASTLVMLSYWYVWTWLSWIIADRKTKERLREASR